MLAVAGTQQTLVRVVVPPAEPTRALRSTGARTTARPPAAAPAIHPPHTRRNHQPLVLLSEQDSSPN